MANILKFKLIISGFSISILILIPLWKSNFGAPVTIKKWEHLSWVDFNGLVKPFTGWGAGISSTVYLEFDSVSRKYTAYAGQNNQKSWVKSRWRGSANLLKHEQYHFNITEVHARMMNEYIEQNPGYELFEKKLESIKSDLLAMQSKYDIETDHNKNGDQQKIWDVRIDSLLNVYSNYSNQTYK